MAQAPPTLQPARLYTWNSQGDFTARDKIQEIDAWMTAPGLALIFVQEGGVALAGEYDNFWAVAGAQVGSFNERCTNYVLFNKAWPRPMRERVLTNANGGVLIGGGVAGRSPAAAEIGRYLFVCWHSLADSNNLDTSELLSTFQTDPKYGEDYDLIVIGGDFNASPDDIGNIVAQIGSRTDPNFYAQVVRCGLPTLKKWGKEVDFFLILRQHWQGESPAGRLMVVESDHWAVETQLLVTV